MLCRLKGVTFSPLLCEHICIQGNCFHNLLLLTGTPGRK